MVKGHKELVDSEKISIKVELEDQNIYGEVRGYREQYIPGTRDTYQTIYTCKHCGAVWIMEKTSDNKHV
jgi:hypothetical protein